jgi:Arc/MetJ-type ribon-helix-helix transcriptional regulator
LQQGELLEKPRPGERLQEAAVSKTFVETSTELLEGLDEMIREGYYANRTEGINDAIRLLLKQYKLSKLHDKDTQAQKTTEKSPVAGGGSAQG